MARSTSSSVAAPGTADPAVPERSLAFHLLHALRPAQWIKNHIVFAGLLFGKRLFDAAAIGDAWRRSPCSASCPASSTS
jgi:hypothetical protein